MVIHFTQCTNELCLDEELEEEEEESFFEEKFWYFIIPSMILLGVSIALEILTDAVLLSQILAVASILLSCYGIVKEAIEDILNKRITANILMLVGVLVGCMIAGQVAKGEVFSQTSFALMGFIIVTAVTILILRIGEAIFN